MYEAAAILNGEMRVYVDTTVQIDWVTVKEQLGYSYALERPHSSHHDPWEYVFADPRAIPDEAEFITERTRVVKILDAVRGSAWAADIMYYRPGTLSLLYHWSSSEGTLHPYRVETVE